METTTTINEQRVAVVKIIENINNLRKERKLNEYFLNDILI